MSAAGTPAQGTPGEKKEEKKPVAKKMPEDIKNQQMMKDYEEKQELPPCEPRAPPTASASLS